MQFVIKDQAPKVNLVHFLLVALVGSACRFSVRFVASVSADQVGAPSNTSTTILSLFIYIVQEATKSVDSYKLGKISVARKKTRSNP